MRRRLFTVNDNYIKITFTVSSTTTQTQIISSDFNGGDQISHITFNTPYNTTKYDYATSYQFTVAGTHIGYIHFKHNATSSRAKLYYNANYDISLIENVIGSNWTLTKYNY